MYGECWLFMGYKHRPDAYFWKKILDKVILKVLLKVLFQAQEEKQPDIIGNSQFIVEGGDGLAENGSGQHPWRSSSEFLK